MAFLLPIEAMAAETAIPVFGADGKFDFCAIEHDYPDKTGLTFAMNSANEINLGATIPNAGFIKNSNYNLKLGFDGADRKKIKALALRENTILLRMGADKSFVQKIETAKDLEIGGGGKTMSFSLASLHTAINSLNDCVKNNKDKINPETTSLPESIKDLLTSAGLKDIVPLSMSGIPEDERPADFAWRSGELLGGYRDIDVPADKDLTTLIGIHINGLKQKCHGSFKADVEKEIKASGMTMRTALASCKTEKQPIVVSILYYLSSSHRLTIISHETASNNKKEALAIRDSLLTTVNKSAEKPK
ncbi:MAG: hypothetical protein PHX43_01380 [Alphaproteobacteria bacterium]|nr:hypothetical protein [Alphaproteobacteria bacterium]